MAVSTSPGSATHAVNPSPPHLRRAPHAYATTAVFEHEYAAAGVSGGLMLVVCTAAIHRRILADDVARCVKEPTATNRMPFTPSPRSILGPATAFTAAVSSSPHSVLLHDAQNTPAQCTTNLTRMLLSTLMSSHIATICAGSLRSTPTGLRTTSSGAAARISSVTALASASVRHAMTSASAPMRASWMATARPMPEPAPVTIAAGRRPSSSHSPSHAGTRRSTGRRL